jgi:heterodisulfide reductase subunit A
MTLAEVKSVSGEVGDFEVNIVQYPRYVDMAKCIACGLCAEKCPKKVEDEYNEGLGKRKAAYVKYAQAVPLKYAIDEANCIYFSKGKCRACEKFCPAGAINFEDQKRETTIKVGSIVLAPGFETYDPAVYDTYGYNQHPNILTGMEFERMLSPSGPYQGHVVRPSDEKEPKKIAWLQCVGSRDTHGGAKGYCSAVCCTYAIKEAIVAKEHIKGELDTAVFYIDIRTHGKDFERYYNRAKDELGVRFIKSRISSIVPAPDTGNLLIRYVDEAGLKVEEEFDLVVLSVGLCISPSSMDLARTLGIEIEPAGFPVNSSFEPVQTTRPGVFVCGAFQSPKDIPSSVMDASACAGAVGSTLAEARKTLTRVKERPPEIDVSEQPPRVGVFVCRCGVNIAGVVDVPAVVEYARTLPGVVYAEENLFSCSQDTQEKMAKVITEQKLNRIVVAACTPRTHEPLFQETLTNAGLNKFLFEMANIRNQNSWVHANEPQAATEKAKDLVRMSVARAMLLEPLPKYDVEVNQAALVIGGGIAGMTAAKNLADQGYHTYLLEKSGVLGGQARSIFHTWKGEDVQEHLARIIQGVQSHDRITVLLNGEIKQVDGFVGNFKTTVSVNGQEMLLEHGAAIIATGASELKPDLYLYGKNPRVLTSLELDRRLIDGDSSLKNVRSAVFIQCVGSRIPERPYCSKVCCTHSIVNALKLKEVNPDMEVFIVYRDLRPYGLREGLYREAREKGVHFIRYDFDQGLTVSDVNGTPKIQFTDYVLQRKMEIGPDLLVLATAIVSPEKNPLAQMFKVPVNEDGFFVEAHVKLRPVDFSTDGVFVCGLAHSPKPIDESVAQGQAAASRASAVLSRDYIEVEGVVSKIDELICRGCAQCKEACPFGAIEMVAREDGSVLARVTEVICKGCGSCAAVCPTGAANICHFTDREILCMVDAALQ